MFVCVLFAFCSHIKISRSYENRSNSNQAKRIFSYVTIISHGKQISLPGNLWRDQRSTNKKNRILPRTFLCGDGGAFVDMFA